MANPAFWKWLRNQLAPSRRAAIDAEFSDSSAGILGADSDDGVHEILRSL